MRSARGKITLFDWVGTLVAIGFVCILLFVVFYPTFEEWYTKLWEEIDGIREKLRRGKEKTRPW